MKVYGPYKRKDGRQHAVIVRDDGTKQTKSYPRHILETKLGRELLSEETVDHINNDFTDDNPDNLQILSRADNAKKAMALKPSQLGTFTCPLCLVSFTRAIRAVRHNQGDQSKAGPFCSRSCAGRYSHTIV